MNYSDSEFQLQVSERWLVSTVSVLKQRSPTFLAAGNGFMEDSFSTDRVGDGSGSNVSDGEQWGTAEEAPLTRPLLTSCWTARFLKGRGPLPVRGLGVGNPCTKELTHRYHNGLN